MVTKKIGDTSVSAPGIGTMSMTPIYGSANPEDSIKCLEYAIQKLGCNFVDTADLYALGANERLVGQVLQKDDNRSKVFLSTKFGFEWTRTDPPTRTGKTNGTPAYARQCLEESIDRLGSAPDLFYLHRTDLDTPIEETVKAMDQLRKEGKCKYIGLSECSADTLKRAIAVVKIDAVQIELSPWSTDFLENGVTQICEENDIAVVAYSPLSRGMLTGKIKSPNDFEQNDFRRFVNRFSPENFPINLKLVDEITKISQKKGCTPGQLTLAWIMSLGNFIPIPGTKNIQHLEENWGAKDVTLTQEEIQAINDVVKKATIVGDRYPAEGMKFLNK